MPLARIAASPARVPDARPDVLLPRVDRRELDEVPHALRPWRPSPPARRAPRGRPRVDEEERVDAGEGRRQRRRVREIADGDVHAIAVARPRLRLVADEDARPLAPLEEAVDDEGSDVSGRAGDEMGHAVLLRICRIARLRQDSVRRARRSVSSRSFAGRAARKRGRGEPPWRLAQVRREGPMKAKAVKKAPARREPKQRRSRETVEAVLSAVVKVMKREGIDRRHDEPHRGGRRRQHRLGLPVLPGQARHLRRAARAARRRDEPRDRGPAGGARRVARSRTSCAPWSRAWWTRTPRIRSSTSC